MSKKKKQRIDVVYSTNPDFQYDYEPAEEQEALPKQEQRLYVSIDRKQRAGKEVTLVEGFAGAEDDLKELARLLKSKCGVGGAAKDGQIMIQGNFKEKVFGILQEEGYGQVKKKGGN